MKEYSPRRIGRRGLRPADRHNLSMKGSVGEHQCLATHFRNWTTIDFICGQRATDRSDTPDAAFAVYQSRLAQIGASLQQSIFFLIAEKAN
jgi:hypothetical protein